MVTVQDRDAALPLTLHTAGPVLGPRESLHYRNLVESESVSTAVRRAVKWKASSAGLMSTEQLIWCTSSTEYISVF